MNTQRTHHFLPLDGMRGIAILLVILVHSFFYNGKSLAGWLMNSLARAGWMGVTLFFVLSGFLITGILLDTHGKRNYLRDFFARRFLRIFPLYFAFLGAYFWAVPCIPYVRSNLSHPTPDTQILCWTYLVNMKGYFGGSTPPPLDPLWSLAVEEQVYLVWPFLIAFVPKQKLPALLIAGALLSLSWRVATRLTGRPIELSYAWTPANLEAFAAGAMVAWLSRNSESKTLAVWGFRVALASGFLVAAMWVDQGSFNFWERPFRILTLGISGTTLFFGAAIVCSVTRGNMWWPNRMLSIKWLCRCGKYSYAMYLFHASVIALISPLLFPGSMGYSHGKSLAKSILFTVIVLLVTFCAAQISWYTWEYPWLTLKRYFPVSGRVVRSANHSA